MTPSSSGLTAFQNPLPLLLPLIFSAFHGSYFATSFLWILPSLCEVLCSNVFLLCGSRGIARCSALKKLELLRVVSWKNSPTRVFSCLYTHLHLYCRPQSPASSHCSARSYCCFHRFFSSLLLSFKMNLVEIKFIDINEFIVNIW